jgi:hypothetical protein
MKSDSTAVTRRDFYNAITVIWVFMMFIIHKLHIAKPNDPSWRDYVLSGAAVGMALLYAALSFRELLRSRKTEARGFPIEPKQSGDSTDI